MGLFKGALAFILCAAILASDDVQENLDVVPGQPQSNGFESAPFQAYELGRYEKRSSGQSSDRVEKGDSDSRGHSFMYFGKRTPNDQNIIELYRYIQKKQEPSWKRGHTIMRFGKRSGDKHNFIRFGKRSLGEEYGIAEAFKPEDKKRATHSIMYFGKREPNENQKHAGHSIMYFGKRKLSSEDPEAKRASCSVMYLRKPDDSSSVDDPDKTAAHSMMYFGKRSDNGEEKGSGHSMMYFGKRRDGETGKSGGHSMMHSGNPANSPDKKTGHATMYFGKQDESEAGNDKRAGHAMMYFRKRNSVDENTLKRGGHAMMNFGKRDIFEDSEPSIEKYDPVKPEKDLKHKINYVGKKTKNPEFVEEKRAHSMIHFGKRGDGDNRASFEKKATHSMIRFGKRHHYASNQSPSSLLSNN